MADFRIKVMQLFKRPKKHREWEVDRLSRGNEVTAWASSCFCWNTKIREFDPFSLFPWRSDYPRTGASRASASSRSCEAKVSSRFKSGGARRETSVAKGSFYAASHVRSSDLSVPHFFSLSPGLVSFAVLFFIEKRGGDSLRGMTDLRLVRLSWC